MPLSPRMQWVLVGAIVLVEVVVLVVLLTQLTPSPPPPLPPLVVVPPPLDHSDGGGDVDPSPPLPPSSSMLTSGPFQPNLDGLLADSAGYWTIGLLSTAFLKTPQSALGGANLLQHVSAATIVNSSSSGGGTSALNYCTPPDGTSRTPTNNIEAIVDAVAEGVGATLLLAAVANMIHWNYFQIGSSAFADADVVQSAERMYRAVYVDYINAMKATEEVAEVTEDLSAAQILEQLANLADDSGTALAALPAAASSPAAASRPPRGWPPRTPLALHRVVRLPPRRRPDPRSTALALATTATTSSPVQRWTYDVVMKFVHPVTGFAMVPDFTGTATGQHVARWGTFSPALYDGKGALSPTGGVVVQLQSAIETGASSVPATPSSRYAFAVYCPAVDRYLVVREAPAQGGTIAVDMLAYTAQWTPVGATLPPHLPSGTSTLNPYQVVFQARDPFMQTGSPRPIQLAPSSPSPSPPPSSGPAQRYHGQACPSTISGELELVTNTGMALQTDSVISNGTPLGTCKLGFALPFSNVRTYADSADGKPRVAPSFLQPSTLAVVLEQLPASPPRSPSAPALSLPPSARLLPLNAINAATSELQFATTDTAQAPVPIGLYLFNQHKLTSLTWPELRRLQFAWFSIANESSGYLLLGRSPNTTNSHPSQGVVWRQSGDVGNIWLNRRDDPSSQTVYVPAPGEGYSEADGSIMFPWARWMITAIVPLEGRNDAVGLLLSAGNLGNALTADAATSRVHSLQPRTPLPPWITLDSVQPSAVNSAAFWGSAAALSSPLMVVLQGATSTLTYVPHP